MNAHIPIESILSAIAEQVTEDEPNDLLKKDNSLK